MGIVLFPQWNLFLACTLVSGKIVLKFAINLNEKNLSTPSCVATVHQLIGSHESTGSSVFTYFSEINLQFSFYKAAKWHLLGELWTPSLRCAEKLWNNLKASLKPLKNLSKKVLKKFKRIRTIKDLVPLHLTTHLVMNDLCCCCFLSVNRTSRARKKRLQNMCI